MSTAPHRRPKGKDNLCVPGTHFRCCWPPPTLALATPAAAAGPGDVLSAYPYRHVSVVPAALAPGTPAPEGTLWVSVDDGAAVPRQQVGRAIPADGSYSEDAALADPIACERTGDQPGVCWKYWLRVGDEAESGRRIGASPAS